MPSTRSICRRLGLLAGAAAVLLAAATAPASAPSTAGDLVLIGGGSKPAEAMKTFIRLAGGPDAPILVFPTASELSDTGLVYRKLFEKEYGCRNVKIAQVRRRRDALRPAIVRQVQEARGIFFSGGDQRRITACLLGTPVGEAVATAHRRGVVIGGTSAGTACMSSVMITGDGNFDVIASGATKVSQGLGLIRGVILDQHFIARRRLNRLLSVVLDHPSLLGIGIDEATAAWFRSDGTMRVLGKGSVVVIDASGATVTTSDQPGNRLGAHGVQLQLLVPGDVLNLAGREVLGHPAPTAP